MFRSCFLIFVLILSSLNVAKLYAKAQDSFTLGCVFLTLKENWFNREVDALGNFFRSTDFTSKGLGGAYLGYDRPFFDNFSFTMKGAFALGREDDEKTTYYSIAPGVKYFFTTNGNQVFLDGPNSFYLTMPWRVYVSLLFGISYLLKSQDFVKSDKVIFYDISSSLGITYMFSRLGVNLEGSAAYLKGPQSDLYSFRATVGLSYSL